MQCLCSDTKTTDVGHEDTSKRNSRSNNPSISSSSILSYWIHAQYWETSQRSGYWTEFWDGINCHMYRHVNFFEYGAHQRHAELIIRQLELSSSSQTVSTSSERSESGVDLSSFFSTTNHILYRSVTMRLCYLALDRSDVQFLSKGQTHWMRVPTVGHLETLKRDVRFLIWHGRLTQEFMRQIEESSRVGNFIDSNHAGFLKTQKSTSSLKLFLLLSECWSYRPEFGRIKVLRSDEGIVSRTWNSLKDLKVDISKNSKIDRAVLEVRVDTSAGRDIALRRGVRRIRHITTPSLWVQKLT